MMPCIAPEIERTIVSLYRNKRYSIRACADHTGVNRNTVAHVLRRNRVPLRHEKRNCKTRWQAPPHQVQWSEWRIAQRYDDRMYSDNGMDLTGCLDMHDRVVGTATGVAA